MVNALTAVAAIGIAYLLGSFPAGYLLGRLWGVNVLQWGSGRTGGTNVFRSAGPVAALLTGALDVGKGALAVWLAGQMTGYPAVQVLAGAAVILGHNQSIFLHFVGGAGRNLPAGRGWPCRLAGCDYCPDPLRFYWFADRDHAHAHYSAGAGCNGHPIPGLCSVWPVGLGHYRLCAPAQHPPPHSGYRAPAWRKQALTSPDCSASIWTTLLLNQCRSQSAKGCPVHIPRISLSQNPLGGVLPSFSSLTNRPNQDNIILYPEGVSIERVQVWARQRSPID
jgi:hypothetical protein